MKEVWYSCWMQTMKKEIVTIPNDRILSGILLVRGKKVMLDKDLAGLYQVKPFVLRQAIKRNSARFPSDFMFQLKKEEAEAMVSQSVIPSMKNFGGSLPYVFTEQGVAMLSSILNSEQAIMVNIQIIRTFAKLREILSTNTKLRIKIEKMEKKHDGQLRQVFDVLKQLIMQEEKPKKPIGF